MKLRQKLAVVMAAAMVVTAVPVVTMAESTNTITRPLGAVEENVPMQDPTTAAALKINFKEFEAGEEEFYLSLTNATFLDAMETVAGSDIEVVKVSEKEVKVVVNNIAATGNITVSGNTIKMPLLINPTGGEVSVSIDKKGSNSSVTEGTYGVLTTADEVATVSVQGATSFNKQGTIGNIVLTEVYAGSMLKNNGTNEVLIDLNNADYDFDVTAATVELTNGFAGQTATVPVTLVDDQTVKVELPTTLSAKSKGTVIVKGLKVKAAVKNPAEGNITVDVSGCVETAKDLIVAVNGDHSAEVSVAKDTAVEVLAGEGKKVNFTIKETVDNTFTNNREMTVAFDGAIMNASYDSNKKVDEAATLSALQTAMKITDAKGATVASTSITEVEIENGKVVGFTFAPATAQTAGLDAFTFVFELKAGLAQSGEIKVTVDSRDFDTTEAVTIANIRSAVEITAEAAEVETGLLNQKVGKITIAETEAGVFNRGEEVVITLPTASGITFSTAASKAPEVTVTAGDAQVSDVKVATDSTTDVTTLTMTIKRASKEASTIEIAGLSIDTDRTVATGSYDVKVGGTALTNHTNDTVVLKDFIKVGMAEDAIGANGLIKGTSTFVIGESTYTVNGVEKTMDAKSFIQDPGYTMIPVRYVAEAFGVSGTDILFSNGTVTIIAGNRTVQLTNGSSVATVNGAQVTMGTKVVIKDGRTYAPVGEVARLLGVSTSWDNETKTATFTNK